jgi:hypothetical protein
MTVCDWTYEILCDENRQDRIEHLRGDVGEQARQGQKNRIPRKTGKVSMCCYGFHGQCDPKPGTGERV